jgi:hypothetical protein
MIFSWVLWDSADNPEKKGKKKTRLGGVSSQPKEYKLIAAHWEKTLPMSWFQIQPIGEENLPMNWA